VAAVPDRREVGLGAGVCAVGLARIEASRSAPQHARGCTPHFAGSPRQLHDDRTHRWLSGSVTTTSTNLTTAPDASAPTRRQSAGSTEDRRVTWRRTLESAWQRKIDEAITLTKASSGSPWDDDGSPASWGMQLSRLQARTERAYEDLAAIEEAMSRVDHGAYGTCAGCDRAMSDEWLAEKPEVRYCPDCS
jgi:DnaK suppressor protein